MIPVPSTTRAASLAYSGAAINQATAISFPSAGDRYSSTAPAFTSETPRTVRIRTRFTSVPSATGTDQIAGFSFSATGWLVSIEDTISGALNTRCVTFYLATGPGVFTLVARKPITAEMIGVTLTWHLHWDTSTSKARVYLDGREIGRGFCNAPNPMGYAFSAYDPPVVALGLGARGSDGAFPWSSGQLVELSVSATSLTRAQILADAQTSPGTPMPGETHRYTPTNATAGTLSDSTGAISLTRTGAPSNGPVTYVGATVKRTWRFFGDSIMAGRQVGNTTGDGYRRGVHKACASAGKGISIVGTASPNASASPDYDFWVDAVGGETLATRLATIVADLGNSAPDIGVCTNHVINDLTGGATAAQVQGLYLTWCQRCSSVTSGPLVIVNATAIGVLASGYSPSVAAQVSLYQSGFAGMIASLRSAGFNVYGADVQGIVTDPNDVTQLYDATHYTPATYSRAIPIVSAAIMEAA